MNDYYCNHCDHEFDLEEVTINFEERHGHILHWADCPICGFSLETLTEEGH